MKTKLQSQFEKTPVIIYQSTIDRAKEFLKESEQTTEISSPSKAKRVFYILEALTK